MDVLELSPNDFFNTEISPTDLQSRIDSLTREVTELRQRLTRNNIN